MQQLVELILLPSGFVALLVVAGAALYFIFKRRHAATYALAAAALTYVVFGSGLVSFWLMDHLEHEFASSQDVNAVATIDSMVVLTGYALPDPRRPITGHVNSASGFRLLEAARIFARTRRMTVIVSGNGEVPVIMKDLLAEIGVPRANIITEQNSANTYESAVHLRDLLAGKQFYLVTSAGHMPRALRAFRKQGLLAVPAPTDYLASRSLRDTSLAPSGKHLAISDLAIHEHLGLMWYRLLDRI